MMYPIRRNSVGLGVLVISLAGDPSYQPNRLLTYHRLNVPKSRQFDLFCIGRIRKFGPLSVLDFLFPSGGSEGSCRIERPDSFVAADSGTQLREKRACSVLSCGSSLGWLIRATGCYLMQRNTPTSRSIGNKAVPKLFQGLDTPST